MIRRWLKALAVMTVLALVVVRDYYDPFLQLFVQDLIRGLPGPLEARLQDGVHVQLYSDARPHVGKVGSLQKGLVLLWNGTALVEEGYGFGLPLVVTAGGAYNSRTASVDVPAEHVWVKTFIMDIADRPTRFLKVKFEPVEPVGTVVVTYTLRPPDMVHVEVDGSDLWVPWESIYVMNEQGALSFPLYVEPSGEEVPPRTTMMWSEATAPFGCWYTRDRELSFCVETEAGQRGFVGRERYNQYRWTGIFYLSWSGIDLVVPSATPRFSYSVRIRTRGS